MGMDLKLLPDVKILSGGMAFSHNVLVVERCTALFDRILELPHWSVPPEFYSRLRPYIDGDGCVETTGPTLRDAYGDPVQMVRAGDLAALRDHEGVTRYGNAPVWAYLSALPPDTLVALFWD